MGSHLIDGEFQSDKYPTCPRGKVPLSVKDPTAQDLLWEYAQRRRSVDEEFSSDLESALFAAGFRPKNRFRTKEEEVKGLREMLRHISAMGPVSDDLSEWNQTDIRRVLVAVTALAVRSWRSMDPSTRRRARLMFFGLPSPSIEISAVTTAAGSMTRCSTRRSAARQRVRHFRPARSSSPTAHAFMPRGKHQTRHRQRVHRGAGARRRRSPIGKNRSRMPPIFVAESRSSSRLCGLFVMVDSTVPMW